MRLFKNTFFYRTSLVAVSDSFRFPACSFVKNGLQQRHFFCEFCKIFKNIFLHNTSGWLLLVFTCKVDKFFKSPILKSTSGKLLISCRSCRISTTRSSAFQALYTKTRRIYSEAFNYLKSLKIICQ